MKTKYSDLLIIIFATATSLFGGCEDREEPLGMQVRIAQLQQKERQQAEQLKQVEPERLRVVDELVETRELLQNALKELEIQRSEALENVIGEDAEAQVNTETNPEPIRAEVVKLDEALQATAVEVDPSFQQALEGEDFQVFFVELARFGEWFQTDDYGYVWQPEEVTADPDWRPYIRGRWLYSDQGWTWVSDEPFGWAVYHYGRWALLQDRGWVWIPGEDWAPAWVSWRSNDDYLGWAPLPPETVYDEDYNYDSGIDSYYDSSPSWYSFVPMEHFYEPVASYCVPRTTVSSIIIHTTNVTRIHIRNKRVYCGGPQYDWVSKRCGRRIARYTLDLRRGRDHGRDRRQHYVEGSDLRIFAPSVKSPWNPAVCPVRVKSNLGRVQVLREGKKIKRSVLDRFHLASVKRQELAREALKSGKGRKTMLRHRKEIHQVAAGKLSQKQKSGSKDFEKMHGSGNAALGQQLSQKRTGVSVGAEGMKTRLRAVEKGFKGDEKSATEKLSNAVGRAQHHGVGSGFTKQRDADQLNLTEDERARHMTRVKSQKEDAGKQISGSGQTDKKFQGFGQKRTLQDVEMGSRKQAEAVVVQKRAKEEIRQGGDKEKTIAESQRQRVEMESRKRTAEVAMKKQAEEETRQGASKEKAIAESRHQKAEMELRKQAAQVVMKKQAEEEVRQGASKEKAITESRRQKAEMELRKRAAQVAMKKQAEEEVRQGASKEKAIVESRRQKAEMELRKRAAQVAMKKQAEEETRQGASKEKAIVESRRQRAEMESRKQAAQVSMKKRAEEEARQRASKEKAIAESRRQKAEMESRKRAAEAASQKRAEEEARQRASKEKAVAESRRQRAEMESRKRASQKRAEEELRQRASKEKAVAESRRQRAEMESRKRAAEAASRKRAEQEAHQRASKEKAIAESRRQRAEMESRKRAAQEASRKRAEKEARRHAEKIKHQQEKKSKGSKRR